MPPDEPNNPDNGSASGQAGSAAGGDNSRPHTARDSASGTGTPSSSSIPVGDLERIIQRATAPLISKIESLENRLGARTRHQRRRDQSAGDDQAETGRSDDQDNASDEDLRREVESLRKAERDRKEREARDLIERTVRGEIARGKFVNADLLENLILPNARASATDPNVVVFDDGRRVVAIDAVIREIGARDVFQPASSGAGAGADNSRDTTAGIQHGGKVLDAAAISGMTDADFAKLHADVRARAE